MNAHERDALAVQTMLALKIALNRFETSTWRAMVANFARLTDTWVDRRGMLHALCDMDTDYLVNVYRYLDRVNHIWHDVRILTSYNRSPEGDGAQFAQELSLVQDLERVPSVEDTFPIAAAIKTEVSRRGCVITSC